MIINPERKSSLIILRHISHFAFFVGTLSLAGCMGIYEEGFECPPGKGVGCKSITEVNDMVNQGEIPLPEISEQDSEIKQNKESKDDSCKTNPSKACPLISDAPDIWYAPWAHTEPLPLFIGKP